MYLFFLWQKSGITGPCTDVHEFAWRKTEASVPPSVHCNSKWGAYVQNSKCLAPKMGHIVQPFQRCNGERRTGNRHSATQHHLSLYSLSKTKSLITMRKRWRLKLPLLASSMMVYLFLMMASTWSHSLFPTTPSAASRGGMTSVMMMGLGAAAVIRSSSSNGVSAASLKDLKEMQLKAGLYDPQKFQGVPSCQYAFASIKIHNTVSADREKGGREFKVERKSCS